MAALGAADNTVMLRDLVTGACLKELKHPECLAAVTFSPDGERLVGCDDSVLHVYAVEGRPGCLNRIAESSPCQRSIKKGNGTAFAAEFDAVRRSAEAILI